MLIGETFKEMKIADKSPHISEMAFSSNRGDKHFRYYIFEGNKFSFYFYLFATLEH